MLVVTGYRPVEILFILSKKSKKMKFMIQIISIEFEYRHKNYYALVRIKERHLTEYCVTIMNGSLEQRLYGNHVFIEDENGFVMDPVPQNKIGELRLAVGTALCKHFNKPYHSRGEAV